MLEGRHYQNAYVTPNIAKWVGYFQEHVAIRKLITYEGSIDVWTPAGALTQT